MGSRRGFTLLELLLVVTILSAVAWMSLGVVNNNADQARFEDTRNRLQTIRRAIIGDTSRTVNGQPELRGYVADMGMLPVKLQALVAQDYCDDLPQYTNTADCTGGGGTWVTQAASSYDPDSGLRPGWSGPYLPVDGLASSKGPRFHDGWGNDDGKGDFGWVYVPYSDSGLVHLLVQSLGRDGLSDSGGGGTGTYDTDYPSADSPPSVGQRLISENQYRIKITESGSAAQGDGSNGLKVDFGAPESCWRCSEAGYANKADCEANGYLWRPRPDIGDQGTCGTVGINWQPSQNLCMAITVVNNGTLSRLDSSGVTITWDGTSKIEEFIFEDATGPSYEEDTYLYQGQMAYGIFEYDNTASPPACDTDKPFPAGSSKWKIFTYVPGTTLVPFEWAVNP